MRIVVRLSAIAASAARAAEHPAPWWLGADRRSTTARRPYRVSRLSAGWAARPIRCHPIFPCVLNGTAGQSAAQGAPPPRLRSFSSLPLRLGRGDRGRPLLADLGQLGLQLVGAGFGAVGALVGCLSTLA